MVKKNWKLILLLATLLAIVYFGLRFNKWLDAKMEAKVEEEAVVLVEKIQTVAKLISTEGYISEIYDYKDYIGYDVSIFRKKALVRVKAKVSVGYDLEKIIITTLPNEKIIVLSQIPQPELLSIDHDLDYYDIQEGWLNEFSTADYNMLNANAKDFIRQKAQESELFDKADLQNNKLYEMIKLMVESNGWILKMEEERQNLFSD